MSENNVVRLDDFRPHVCFEAMCIACSHRWQAVAPDVTILADIECPACDLVGTIIVSGQDLFV